MKKVFIYYSLTGNGDYLADLLKERDFEIRKVIEKKKMPKVFFFRVLLGGFRAALKLKGKLIDYDNDVSKFDEIVIGTPVWNGRFPPAINSVLASTNFKNKNLSFLFYSGSGDIPKVNEEINKRYPNCKIYILKEPKSHNKELDKIKDL